MNIFLDLDQTAILSLDDKDVNDLPHSTDELAQWPVENMDNEFLVFSRPGLSKFLDYLFQNHHVSVWSAASQPYVLHIVRHVIQKNRTDRPIRYIFWDEHCRHSRKHYKKTKDLRLLWERYRLPGIAAGNTILIDDLPSTHKPQPCHVVPIEPFEALDPDDQALEAVIERLRRLAPTDECPLQPGGEEEVKTPDRQEINMMSVADRVAFQDEFEGPPDGSRASMHTKRIKGRNVQCFKNACILERIGKASVNAEAYKVCYPLTKSVCGPLTLALKSIKLDHTSKRHYIKYRYTTPITNKFFAELIAMELCSVLVRNRVCPNLPMYFRHTIHEDNLYIINEYATGGTFGEWIEEKARTYMEWMVTTFQVFAALRALQKYFNLTHYDLHIDNLLYHKIPAGGYWEYVIDGKHYKIPNLGFLWVLWDFGLARIPLKIEPKEYIFHYLEKQRAVVDYVKYSNAPSVMAQHGIIRSRSLPLFFRPNPKTGNSLFDNVIEGHLNEGWIRTLLPKLFGHFTTEHRGGLIETYNCDIPFESLDIPNHLVPFLANQNVIYPIEDSNSERRLEALLIAQAEAGRKLGSDILANALLDLVGQAGSLHSSYGFHPFNDYQRVWSEIYAPQFSSRYGGALKPYLPYIANEAARENKLLEALKQYMNQFGRKKGVELLLVELQAMIQNPSPKNFSPRDIVWLCNLIRHDYWILWPYNFMNTNDAERRYDLKQAAIRFRTPLGTKTSRDANRIISNALGHLASMINSLDENSVIENIPADYTYIMEGVLALPITLDYQAIKDRINEDRRWFRKHGLNG